MKDRPFNFIFSIWIFFATEHIKENDFNRTLFIGVPNNHCKFKDLEI